MEINFETQFQKSYTFQRIIVCIILKFLVLTWLLSYIIVCPKNISFLATSLRPHLRVQVRSCFCFQFHICNELNFFKNCVQVHSYGAGGNAFFTCQNGYTLEGDVDSAKCMGNGEWSVALLGRKIKLNMNNSKYNQLLFGAGLWALLLDNCRYV